MNTKGIFTIIVSLLLAIVSFSAFGAAAVATPTIDSVIVEIMASQNVDSSFAIDPTLVDQKLLSDLGNAIIADQYPAALLGDVAKQSSEGIYSEGTAALGYDYLTSQWLWQKDYGVVANAGSGWAYHDTQADISAGM